MEESPRVIDQLHNDLDLLDMPKVPSDDPIESREGLSDLDLIQIEEIIVLDDPEVLSP
jgi:hypothetical protein